MGSEMCIRDSETACGWSARFQSVIGGGPVTVVETAEEKRAGLRVIMKHLTGRDQWEFEDRMVELVCVFKLEVEELSCKEHH